MRCSLAKTKEDREIASDLFLRVTIALLQVIIDFASEASLHHPGIDISFLLNLWVLGDRADLKITVSSSES